MIRKINSVSARLAVTINQVMSGDRHTLYRLLPILCMVFAGCSESAHVVSLDEVLKNQEIGKQEEYGLRCTAGAHRGASVDHKENTMAALIAADRSDKYAFIEFDVQYSKDREIVVFHDSRMLRLFGSLRSIGSTDYAKLVEITEGEIAAYYDVVGLLSKKLNIEIKSQGERGEDELLADEIISDIRKRNRQNDILISSISSDVIQYINSKYPEIPTGQIFWLTSSTYLPFEVLTQKLFEKIDESKADYLMLHVANLRNVDDLLKLKPRRKTLVFWDFDDNMYILHKDLSDRLWGDSFISEFYQTVRYNLSAVF